MNRSKAQPLIALLLSDLKRARRHGGQSLLPLVFLFSVVAMIPLGIGPGPNLLQAIAPGMIWVAALLSGLLALDGLFKSDFDDGTLEQWWVGDQPVIRLVLVRLGSHWLITALPVIVLTPVAAQMLYLPNAALGLLMLTLLIGTPILSLVGGLASALTLGTRQGGALLGLLIFPLIVPVLIFSTGAVSAFLDGLPVRPYLLLLVALLVLALSLVPLATAAALRLNIE